MGTFLLPRFRESQDEVVEGMVDRALSLASVREPEATYVGSPGEVFFYRTRDRHSYVLYAQLIENGGYDDLFPDHIEVDEDPVDEFEALYA